MKGPRPWTWRVQGEIPHQQSLAFQRQRAQAKFRGEYWSMSFEQFQYLWQDLWHLRGKQSQSLCMTRIDPELDWSLDNCVICTRREYLQQARIKQLS
jgi:hypothetical protein